MTCGIPVATCSSTIERRAERLDSPEILARHLAHLVNIDPRLMAIAERVGSLDTRRTPRGFAGMANIVCGQLLSVASAKAIWSRYERLTGALEAETFLALDEGTVRATGFSGGKYRTLKTIAEAIVEGRLDLDHLENLPAEMAIEALTRLKGIGPWTAEVYLLFCAGHPDIFPAGDLALRKAVGEGLGLSSMPSARELIALAGGWSPYRGTAALLFWRYFAVLRKKEGIGL